MITVLGASGFIGSHLTTRLKTHGGEYQAIGRHDALPAGSLGHVIYCIGLTADFRSRPFDTVEAHVCKLLEILREGRFESLLYLSSTRLYRGADSTREDAPICIRPLDPGDLYNASKTMGESLTLNCGRDTRVVRVSNVYGADFNSHNFLSSIIKDAFIHKEIVLQTSADSAKDYVALDNVTDTLLEIATSGQERIYNLASGFNVSNGELAEMLRRLTGCTVTFSPDAPSVVFPEVHTERLRSEFDFQPSYVLDDLPLLVDLYRRNLESSNDHG